MADSRTTDLKQQLAEALARETATAEILKVIASSPSDVQPVFDAIAASARRLLDANAALVARRVGDMVELAAYTSTGEVADAELRKLFPAKITGQGHMGQAILTRAPVRITDILTDERYSEAFRASVRARGLRSVVTVPMLRDGEAIGGISVNRTVPGTFSDHQTNLLKTFADQAVIAIENARLFNETREALERQTATAGILKVIASSPSDVQPVFDAIAESAMRLLGARSAGVTRVSGDSIHLAAHTSTNETGNEALRALFPLAVSSPTVIGSVVRSGESVSVADTDSDPQISPQGKQVARERGYRSQLTVPMLREGIVIGTIGVSRVEPGPFADHHVGLLKTFADQAVIAIENVRLFNETKEALDRQTATAEILKVIARSPSDVQPVFDAIAQAAVRLIGGFSATVTRTENGIIHLVAMTSTGSAGDDAVRRLVFPRPIGDGVIRRAIESKAPFCRPDVETDPAINPVVLESARSRGFRSIIAVPMLKDGAAIGVILVTRREPGAFTANQTDLLKTFADQAVIAIENVRLFNEAKALEEERLARLKSFFSPQLADLLAAGKGDELLKTHRREITVQFFDLRGFTAFTGAAEPEEVMELLSEFHGALGCLVMQEQGTIERFAGDSVMVFFNDPLPVERPAERAMRSALAMMGAFDPIAARWKKRGYDLGLGAGIAQGYATLGAIGFEGRRDYAAIGPVTNLAARLCAEAKSGQILADQKTVAALEGAFDFDAQGELNLKGFAKPVSAFALRRA